jgi:hypothetical protein
LSGFLHALWIVVLCTVLVMAEVLVVAFAIAPRFVARKLGSLLRALVRRAERVLGILSPRGDPARPFREGT